MRPEGRKEHSAQLIPNVLCTAACIGGGKGWTDEDLQKAKQDLLSYVIRNGNRYGTMMLARVSPGLAGLNNWAESL